MSLITEEAVHAQLVGRGIISEDLEPSQYHYSRYGQFRPTDIDDEEENDVYVCTRWQEPIPGLHLTPGGFDPALTLQFGGWYDHHSSMAEIHLADGIEWHISRVIFGQPYLRHGDGLVMEASLAKSMYTLGMEVTVLDEENMSWYNTNTKLCICKPINPMPFYVFRKTFRYWLICNTTEGMTPSIKLGVLPDTAVHPQHIFFDLILDASLQSVRLGLNNESCDEALNSCASASPEFITRETFELLWHKYRWTNNQHVFIVLRFIARLKAWKPRR